MLTAANPGLYQVSVVLGCDSHGLVFLVKLQIFRHGNEISLAPPPTYDAYHDLLWGPQAELHASIRLPNQVFSDLSLGPLHTTDLLVFLYWCQHHPIMWIHVEHIRKSCPLAPNCHEPLR